MFVSCCMQPCRSLVLVPLRLACLSRILSKPFLSLSPSGVPGFLSTPTALRRSAAHGAVCKVGLCHEHSSVLNVLYCRGVSILSSSPSLSCLVILL